MLGRKPCTKEGCENPRWAKGLCQMHDKQEHPEKYTIKQKKVEIKKTPIKRKRKVTGEFALMQAIWNTRPHRSFVSGERILGELKPHYMAHVLSKGAYPAFRLKAENIVILTEREHYAYDCLSREQQEEMVGDWQKLYDLKEKLKKEYYNSEKSAIFKPQ
jgi:hypothetical protein